MIGDRRNQTDILLICLKTYTSPDAFWIDSYWLLMLQINIINVFDQTKHLFSCCYRFLFVHDLLHGWMANEVVSDS